jgi:hypothetical protein
MCGLAQHPVKAGDAAAAGHLGGLENVTKYQ